ncbi:branched-chain amino acid aminotransferase [Luteimonas sp. J16]|jgi:branched-chain amino acid aminotransferase|uniref:aminotransferase class IV n=1 Tax=unclassified Luteimonas TaxID=2629088 RepID=UPI0004AE4413|nr:MULTISPECIES: aminotransferase class IV [unclassified Luteimonas]TWG90217.1 branched-chain amino acid aminotransferase [Luteimonas sp. J16]
MSATVTPLAEAPRPQAAASVALAWFDGGLVPADGLQAGLTTHAMHYGSGVFEGIRAYALDDGGAAVFRLPEHLERMRRGAEMFGLPFDPAQATAAVLATLRANGHRDAYIRPLAWFGEGSFGLDVEGHVPHLMVATTATQVHLNGSRARLGVSNWRRNPSDSLPPLKLCGGYVNSILAKREAKARGFDEALFTDRDGLVVECTGANVFMVRDGRLTAVAHGDSLDGITRDTLLRLTGAEARPVPLAELLEADEVFACGTAAEVAPVAQIEDRQYGDNPVTRELQALYARVVRGREAAWRHWLTEV